MYNIVQFWQKVSKKCGKNHIRDINAALNLKQNAIENVGRGASEFKSAESVESLAMLALQAGAFDETENLTGDGQNALTK